jgi:MFS family permease
LKQENVETDPGGAAVAYAVQPFVWTLGSIVGAALGGFLAQPAHFYPDLFPADGLFGRYPYLLPNLMSIFFIAVAIIQGIIFLEETNPRAKARTSARGTGRDETTPLLNDRARAPSVPRSSFGEDRPFFVEEGLPAPGQQTFDIRRNSFGTMHSIELPKNLRPDPTPENEEPLEYNGPVWTRTIVMLIVALVLIAYHQMAAGALLPIHLQDMPTKPHGKLDLIGGFGLDVHDVSVYLMVNGFLSLFVQAFIFPTFVGRVGVWYSFLCTVILYPTAYLVIPFLSAIPKLLSPGIYFSLILQAFYGIVSVPSALILLKDAVPSPLVLGRVNGLAMSACCAARTVSPPLVGLLYNTRGSAAAWFSCAAVGVIGALQLLWVPRHPMEKVTIDRPVIGQVEDTDESDASTVV